MLLISLWQKKNQNTRPEILLWNAPVDNKIEQKFILTGKNAGKLLPLLISGARKLEAGGADFLVLPCNSLHLFMKKIRESVGIPVVSIVEETTKFVAGKKIGQVGLLGTKATIKAGIFNSPFRKHNISVLVPEGGEQTSLGVNLIDTLEILAKATVEKMREQ